MRILKKEKWTWVIVFSFIASFLALGTGKAKTPPAASKSAVQTFSIMLLDVHPLWGGENIYLKANGDGWLQIVNLSSNETRYASPLDAADIQQLEALLTETDFIHMKIKERKGIPDERRPMIHLRLKSGEIKIVEKWSGDKNANFDKIYNWLDQKFRKALTNKPEYQGPFDPKWRPEGLEAWRK